MTVWKPGEEPKPAPVRQGSAGRPRKLLRRDSKHQPVSVKEIALSLPAEAWKKVIWRQGVKKKLQSLSGISAVFQTTATAGIDNRSSSGQPRADVSGPQRSAPSRPDWRASLMLLWAAGSAVVFAQMLSACAGMWRLRRSARPSPFGGLSKELRLLLRIGRPVDVLETAPGTMPMTFGIVRPAVFLPCDAEEWTEERRRIVLLHELAHVRRGDAGTQLLARFALILNWWSPLAWRAWREFLKEREHATDDLVLHAGERPSAYAGHLLELARTMQAAPIIGARIPHRRRRPCAKTAFKGRTRVHGGSPRGKIHGNRCLNH